MKDAGRSTVPIEEVQPFENIEAILEIPEALKIAKVVSGLAASMEKRGFLAMRVVIPADLPDEEPAAPAVKTGPESAQKQHRARVAEAKKFIETLEPAAESRDKASTRVEEMLDQGRSGSFSTKAAEAAVADLIQGGKTTAVKALAGLKGSDQTYAHCVDMSVIFQEAYADILKRTGKEISPETNQFNLLAGFMHDIGKSEVPKEILESTKRFAPDSQEMLILRNHTMYGARILEELGLHKAQINVAHYHHVKKDSTLFTSYPDVPYDDVLPVTRLASITDVYQALIGRRRYKKNWVPAKAIDYMMKLSGSEFDERMLEHFVRSVGRYPVGSLLKLSTGQLAFVVRLGPEEADDSPVVVAVESANGELLEHNELIDLAVERDISIEEIVDHYDHYNETEDQSYQIFRSISLG